MANPLDIIGSVFGLGGDLFAGAEQKKAQQKQERATEYNLESSLWSMEHNIGEIGHDIESLKKDKAYALYGLEEAQGRFSREQGAAIGASGAVLGGKGTTPLGTIEKTGLLMKRDREALETSFGAAEGKLERERTHTQEQLRRGDTLYEETYGKKRNPTPEEIAADEAKKEAERKRRAEQAERERNRNRGRNSDRSANV